MNLDEALAAIQRVRELCDNTEETDWISADAVLHALDGTS